jgi:pimeloyl-ACP methyl ester carboxylesterase
MIKRKQREIITDFGGSGKTIVLLHGFISSSAYWKRLQPHLTKAGYRVVTIDLLGFGSAKATPALVYDYPEHIQHIHESIRSLKLDEPFILVGHSMGALLAARYGITHPDDIQTVFLLHPPIYRNRPEARKALRSTGRGYRFLLDSRFRGLGWGALKAMPNIPVSKHSRKARELSLVNVIESTELFNDLERLHINAVLLVGRRDRVEYLQNISEAQLRKNISLKIEDVSHNSPAFRPKLIAETIMQFSETD